MSEQETKKPETKVFEVADFHLKCYGCGNDVVVIPNVKGGLRTDLYTTNEYKFTMECSKCGAKLEYYFTEAANPEIEEDEKNEEVQDKVEEDSESQPTTEESLPVEEPQQTVEVTE